MFASDDDEVSYGIGQRIDTVIIPVESDSGSTLSISGYYIGNKSKQWMSECAEEFYTNTGISINDINLDDININIDPITQLISINDEDTEATFYGVYIGEVTDEISAHEIYQHHCSSFYDRE